MVKKIKLKTPLSTISHYGNHSNLKVNVKKLSDRIRRLCIAEKIKFFTMSANLNTKIILTIINYFKKLQFIFIHYNFLH